MKATWTNSYGNNDHILTISEIIKDYFDKLGQQLINCRNEGIYCASNPVYASNMLEMGLVCTHLSGGFCGGESSKVSKDLFGNDSMPYQIYFHKIYDLLMEQQDDEKLKKWEENILFGDSLPDDSGEKKYKCDLPDDSGNSPQYINKKKVEEVREIVERRPSIM